MRKTIIILVIIGAALLVISLLGPYYILTEGEQAVIVLFGKILLCGLALGISFSIDQVKKPLCRLNTRLKEPGLFEPDIVRRRAAAAADGAGVVGGAAGAAAQGD